MNIVLKDGTTISAEHNEYFFGEAYDLEKAVPESVFTESNLDEVTIDGVNKGYMILDFYRPDGLQFGLREPTEIERRLHNLELRVSALEPQGMMYAFIRFISPEYTSALFSSDKLTLIADGKNLGMATDIKSREEIDVDIIATDSDKIVLEYTNLSLDSKEPVTGSVTLTEVEDSVYEGEIDGYTVSMATERHD